MPAQNLATLSTIPHVHSGTTPSTINTCQLVTVPASNGVMLIIHNRDKASKTLRISWDPSLTQDGAAPSSYFTVADPVTITLDHSAASGFVPSTQLALFSSSASVNYELLFVPA
jgi:hypothetical protein